MNQNLLKQQNKNFILNLTLKDISIKDKKILNLPDSYQKELYKYLLFDLIPDISEINYRVDCIYDLIVRFLKKESHPLEQEFFNIEIQKEKNGLLFFADEEKIANLNIGFLIDCNSFLIPALHKELEYIGKIYYIYKKK